MNKEQAWKAAAKYWAGLNHCPDEEELIEVATDFLANENGISWETANGIVTEGEDEDDDTDEGEMKTFFKCWACKNWVFIPYTESKELVCTDCGKVTRR